MKKVLLSLAVVAALGMTSCGGVDGETMAKEYCACTEKTDPEEMLKCVDEWSAKYKDAKATEEQKKIAEEKMKECMPGL